MTYNEAKAHAERGRAVVLSMAGGWKRYGWFTLEQPTGIVEVRLFHTTIGRFYPNGELEIRTGGHMTATTIDALNALASGHGRLWRDKGQLYYHQHNGGREAFTEGMKVPA